MVKLTESQKTAVSNTSGITLINSSAGSGKTSVFTARIANLIKNEGIPAESILGLTFTNEAAESMKKKLGKIVGKQKAKEVPLSTFHSFAYRFLKSRFAAEYIDKKIVPNWWKLQTAYDIVGEKSYRNEVGQDLNLKAGELLGFISYQKANGVRPNERVVIDTNVAYVENIDRSELQTAFNTYCKLAKNARVIDFDDMLLDFFYKLLENSDIVAELQSKYKYVMVDEFQDTNYINMEILKLITNDNLFVVGDFRQGIYSFINANINNILKFKETFPSAQLVELQSNFRSTNNIVQICNDVIAASPVGSYKEFSEQISASGESGEPIRFNLYNNDGLESRDVCETINDLLESNSDLTYDDFCILCRTNAQLGDYESKLADMDIPADVSCTRSFFDRKEIADLLAYSTHTIMPSDDMSLRRIVNSPNRFIAKAAIAKLDEYAFKKQITMEDAMVQMDSGKNRSRLLGIVDTFEDLREVADKMNASKFLKLIYKKTRYDEFLSQKTTSHTDYMIKKESIDRLFEMAKKFTTIEKFLGHISVIQSNNKKSENAVHLMTVHASKGLEFDTVFVPSVTAKNYPHEMNPNVEEERRLLYVALSRAKNRLYVSSTVFMANKQETVKTSPFLEDIATEALARARQTVVRGSLKASFTYRSSRQLVQN